jgi:Susd and RagB outer membrane lipoprotein
MNFIAREYWIAAFGNGVEAYNMYRRTGLPSGMQPTLDPNPGDFPRSWWYPQTYVTLNSNAEQKADLTTKVFWDKNASDLNF